MKFIAKKFNVFTHCMQIILINILIYENGQHKKTQRFLTALYLLLRLAMCIWFLIASKDELNLEIVRVEYI